MNHRILLLNTGYSLQRLMQQNPGIGTQFSMLGIDFSNEVTVTSSDQLIGQISRSVKDCRLLLILDSDPQLHTREILAQGFNRPLHQDTKAKQDLQSFCQKTGRQADQSILDSAMMPQDAAAISDPNCGQAGFAMFFPSTCIVLIPGSVKTALPLLANPLFDLLLHNFYPASIMVDVPLKSDRTRDVQEYLARVKRRSHGFLPILGGSTDNPVLRLIATQEDEKHSRQCCNSFLEDLVSECGNVTAISGVGVRGLRAVEKRTKKENSPAPEFAGSRVTASTASAASSTPPAMLISDADDGLESYPPEPDDDLLWSNDSEPDEPAVPQKRRERKQTGKKAKRRTRWSEPPAEEENGGKRSPLIKFLLAVFILIFLGCITYLGQYYWKSAQNRNAYESLREVYDGHSLIAPLGYPLGYDNDFSGLWEINKDIVGWLSIDGTALDYPVVQTDNNDTYYRTNFEGEYSEHAVPFVDAAVDLKAPSRNIIIYGHNIRADGQMFNILKGYKELSFYQQHPVVEFNSVYHKGKYKIISVFYANTRTEHGKIFPYHEFINPQSKQETQDYIDDVLVRSIINTGVDVKPSDELLTLSTCTYEFKDARFVVVARKVRSGESAEVDTSSAVMNPSTLYPDVWYQLFGGSKPDEDQLKANLPDR